MHSPHKGPSVLTQKMQEGSLEWGQCGAQGSNRGADRSLHSTLNEINNYQSQIMTLKFHTQSSKNNNTWISYFTSREIQKKVSRLRRAGPAHILRISAKTVGDRSRTLSQTPPSAFTLAEVSSHTHTHTHTHTTLCANNNTCADDDDDDDDHAIAVTAASAAAASPALRLSACAERSAARLDQAGSVTPDAWKPSERSCPLCR